jgi:hypothetical protein
LSKAVKELLKSCNQVGKKLSKSCRKSKNQKKVNRPENKNENKNKNGNKNGIEDNWYSLDQVPTTSHLIKNT